MRSLRIRLALWFSLAVTIMGGAAAWTGHLIVRHQMERGVDFLLDAEIQEIVARLGERPERLSAEAVAEAIRDHAEIDAPFYFFQVRKLGHGVVYRSRNLIAQSLPDIPDATDKTVSIVLDEKPVVIRERKVGDLLIQVAMSGEQINEMIRKYRTVLTLSVPVLFAASVVVGWFLATAAMRPVGAMQRAARRISASNLAERLPVPGGRDEIADLARLLNDLFARLEASFEQVKRFTGDASHELKTPLSLIRLHAERLAKSPRLDAADRTEIEEQIEEITRLNKLIENLLLLARADAGSLHLERRLLNTAAFVSGFSEDASVLAEDAGLRFAVTKNEEVQASFDPMMIRHVFLNLLSNALRHSAPGKTISLHSGAAASSWEIDLTDEGPGILADQLDHVFERFVRKASPDGKQSEGSGLGLAIAKSIVEAHGGSIVAENRAVGGLSVRVKLPASPAHGARV